MPSFYSFNSKILYQTSNITEHIRSSWSINDTQR